MFKLSKYILTTSIKTQTIEKNNDALERIGDALSKQIMRRFQRSLAIRMVDAGSCNACELEIQALNNPYYSIEQYGIQFVASPRHADLLLVTGPVTKNMHDALLITYEAMPDPKLVVAIGDCAHCGGIFKDSYAVVGAVSAVIPVNYVVKGCPPSPCDIISGILAAISE